MERARPAVVVGVILVLAAIVGVVVLARSRGSGAGWTTQEVGGLALSLPGSLVPAKVELPPEVKSATETFSVAQVEADGVTVSVTYARYVKGVIASLDGAIAGTLSNIALRAKDGKITESRTATTLDGRTGAVVEFRLASMHDPLAGRGLFFTDRNEAWQVLVVHAPANESGPAIATRISESARFTGR